MTRKPKGSGRMIVLKCRVTDWVSFKFIQFLKLHSTGLLRQKYKTSRVINKIVAFYADNCLCRRKLIQINYNLIFSFYSLLKSITNIKFRVADE